MRLTVHGIYSAFQFLLTADNSLFHGANIKNQHASYKRKTIQHASAHSLDKVQDVYLEGHELPFGDVEIGFSASEIGGEFK